EVGATYRIALLAPPEVDPLDLSPRLLDARGVAVPGSNRAALRSGVLPWVRFPVDAAHAMRDGPWRLEVRTRFWTGSAEVTRKWGVEPLPVTITLEHRGELELLIRAEHRDVIDWSTVRLESAQGEPLPHPVISFPSHHGEASLKQKHLEPGRYRWRVGSLDGEVEVMAGEHQRVEIELPHPDATFDVVVPIDATAVPDLDLERSEFSFNVSRLEGGLGLGDRRLTPVRAESGTPGEWELQLDGLPRGEWGAFVGAHSTPVRWERSRVFFEPGVEPEALVALEVIEGPPAAARLLDGVSDATVARAQTCWFTSAAQPALNEPNAAGIAVSPALFDGEQAELIVTAPGYEQHSVLVASRPDGAPTDVRLVRGWSAIVRVLDLRQWAPVEGVEVFADGVSLGHTDANGRVTVRGDGPPKTLDLGPDEPEGTIKPPQDGEHPLRRWAPGWMILVDG
ncbi:MAG: hypothetical protein AAF602_31635, partial [Myxococcota bacterium]